LRVAVLVRDFGPICVGAESIFGFEGDVISLIIKFRLTNTSQSPRRGTFE
jgi:hypothetical protein